MGAVDLLLGGVGGWRNPPQFQEAEALIELSVGEEVELVREEGGWVDRVVAEGLGHVVWDHGFVVGWRGAARRLGEGLVPYVVAVVVVG